MKKARAKKIRCAVDTASTTDVPFNLPSKVLSDEPILQTISQAKPAQPSLTARGAERARVRLVKHLRELGANDVLAVALDGCRASVTDDPAPCWRGPCPVCGRLLQRWLEWTAPVAVRRVLRARGSLTGNGPWLSQVGILEITAPWRLTHLDGCLAHQQLNNVVDGMRGVLEGAGPSMFIGAINFSGIRDRASNLDLHYYVHLHAFALMAEIDLGKIKAGLVKRFGLSRGDRRLGLAKIWRLSDHDVAARHQLVRSDFEVRTVTSSHQPTKGKRVRQRTRLQTTAFVEPAPLLSFLDDLGLRGRLFLHGARIKSNTRGRLVIRPLPETLRKREKDPLLGYDEYFADLDGL